MMSRRPTHWPTTSPAAEQEHLRPALYNLITCAVFTSLIFCLRLTAWHWQPVQAGPESAHSRAALLHLAQTCGKNVTRIAILGERHTGKSFVDPSHVHQLLAKKHLIIKLCPAAGSNLAEQLLQRNLGGSISVTAGFTQHKHWMQVSRPGLLGCSLRKVCTDEFGLQAAPTLTSWLLSVCCGQAADCAMC